MTIKLTTMVTKITVTIFGAGRNVIGECIFNTAANLPSIEIVSFANLAACRVKGRTYTVVGIATANISQRLVCHQIPAAERQIEVVEWVNRERFTAGTGRDLVVNGCTDPGLRTDDDTFSEFVVIASISTERKRVARNIGIEGCVGDFRAVIAGADPDIRSCKSFCLGRRGCQCNCCSKCGCCY